MSSGKCPCTLKKKIPALIVGAAILALGYPSLIYYEHKQVEAQLEEHASFFEKNGIAVELGDGFFTQDVKVLSLGAEFQATKIHYGFKPVLKGTVDINNLIPAISGVHVKPIDLTITRPLFSDHNAYQLKGNVSGSIEGSPFALNDVSLTSRDLEVLRTEIPTFTASFREGSRLEGKVYGKNLVFEFNFKTKNLLSLDLGELKSNFTRSLGFSLDIKDVTLKSQHYKFQALRDIVAPLDLIPPLKAYEKDFQSYDKKLRDLYLVSMQMGDITYKTRVPRNPPIEIEVEAKDVTISAVTQKPIFNYVGSSFPFFIQAKWGKGDNQAQIVGFWAPETGLTNGSIMALPAKSLGLENPSPMIIEGFKAKNGTFTEENGYLIEVFE